MLQARIMMLFDMCERSVGKKVLVSGPQDSVIQLSIAVWDVFASDSTIASPF